MFLEHIVNRSDVGSCSKRGRFFTSPCSSFQKMVLQTPRNLLCHILDRICFIWEKVLITVKALLFFTNILYIPYLLNYLFKIDLTCSFTTDFTNVGSSLERFHKEHVCSSNASLIFLSWIYYSTMDLEIHILSNLPTSNVAFTLVLLNFFFFFLCY